jgi:6-phosphofructokinase 1
MRVLPLACLRSGAAQIQKLTRKRVQNIHLEGGSVLGTSRGGGDVKRIVDSIIARGINALFVLGGNGTHAGADAIYQECVRRGYECAVVGVPKTIDNDILHVRHCLAASLGAQSALSCLLPGPILTPCRAPTRPAPQIDKTFGFDTAVEEAQRAMRAASIEAKSAYRGVGVVKLMGRQSGFIAMYASIASGEVDVSLIPEVPFVMDGPNGVVEHLKYLLEAQGHAIVCLAEGAGQEFVMQDGLDPSGNPILGDIGPWFCKKVKKALGADVKYIDPTYMVRGCTANAHDKVYCNILGQNAAHAAMAGFTGCSVGLVNTHYVYLPIPMLIEKPRYVDPNSRMYQRMLGSTGQPEFAN